MRVSSQTIEIVNNLPYPVCVKSSASGKYLLVNPAFCKLFSLASDNEVVGKTDKELEGESGHLQTVFSAGGEVLIDRDCYQVSVTAIQRNQAELYTFTRLDDCERLRQSLQNSKERENFLFGVIGCMPGNVYWLDSKGYFQGCNDNVAKMLGFTSNKEIIGLRHEDTAKLMGWAEGQAESFRYDDLKVLKNGEGIFGIEEPPIKNIDGQTVYYLTSRVPLRNQDGKIAGVVGISVDITKRRRAELALQKAKQEAEAANQAKSEFLAMMTHELRTPLNVILGMVQIMQSKECGRSEQLDFLQTMFSSGRSLLGLIDDILDFSKAQSGKLKLKPETFEIQSLLSQLKKEFTVKGQENNVKYSVRIDPELPRYLFADRQRLRQVICNLSDNALKFTSNGTVTIFVDKCLASKTNHIGLRVRVQDTGLGIPEEKLQTVFDEFTQVSEKKHTEYSRRYGGVGLGLAIVRKLIDLMEAKISVTSELGKGTTFTCEFEFSLPTFEQIEELVDALTGVDALSKSFRPSRALLVEDTPLNQRVAIHLLEKLNCTVELAVNGEEALDKLQSSYDFIFMDMTLPDLSGVEVTKQYRAKEQPERHQLIIALTANTHADDREACAEAGMDDFLTKPIMIEELYQLFKQHIGFE